jgi:hypothetical protein
MRTFGISAKGRNELAAHLEGRKLTRNQELSGPSVMTAWVGIRMESRIAISRLAHFIPLCIIVKPILRSPRPPKLPPPANPWKRMSILNPLGDNAFYGLPIRSRAMLFYVSFP